jgi:hypothetical protein
MTMRNVAIIGAGQAGLLLGLGLLEKGYRVTLVSDRTADEVRHGNLPAGVMVFDRALQVERELGVGFWDGVARDALGVHVDVIAPPGQIAMSIESNFERPGLSVDQRLKFSRWMDEFERRGGRLVIEPATTAGLEALAREHDLVVIAVGKGELSGLFPKYEERSPFHEPPRHVAAVAILGHKGWANYALPGARLTIIPGIGEFFAFPFYAKDEIQAFMLGFEAIPGGPMDRFRPGMSAPECLETAKQIYRDLLPWDHDAVRDATLADERAALAGALLPIVRHPVGRLPSGAVVMGIGDTVILNDPLAAQGANNASLMARLVKERIVEHGDRPFDPAWMTAVFEEFWTYCQYGNLLSQTLLMPPEPPTLEIMGAASQDPAVAHDFINGFVYPPALFPWLVDPVESKRYLQSRSIRPMPPG